MIGLGWPNGDCVAAQIDAVLGLWPWQSRQSRQRTQPQIARGSPDRCARPAASIEHAAVRPRCGREAAGRRMSSVAVWLPGSVRGHSVSRASGKDQKGWRRWHSGSVKGKAMRNTTGRRAWMVAGRESRPGASPASQQRATLPTQRRATALILAAHLRDHRSSAASFAHRASERWASGRAIACNCKYIVCSSEREAWDPEQPD